MSETNLPINSEFSTEQLEAVNHTFLNKLQSERNLEENCFFVRIRDKLELTRTISQIRRAQTQIAIERSAIATAIAQNKIAECRNTQARIREWLLKK